jgi:hypothetical protein
VAPLILFSSFLLFDRVLFDCVLIYQSHVFDLSHSIFEESDVLADS